MALSGEVVVTITEHQDDQGCHLALHGRLDVRTVADLRTALHQRIAMGTTPVLLDLGAVHVGDATGFGLIVECLRRSRLAGRPVRIVAADDRTRRLLRRARLGSLLLGPAPECLVGSQPAMAGAAG